MNILLQKSVIFFFSFPSLPAKKISLSVNLTEQAYSLQTIEFYGQHQRNSIESSLFERDCLKKVFI